MGYNLRNNKAKHQMVKDFYILNLLSETISSEKVINNRINNNNNNNSNMENNQINSSKLVLPKIQKWIPQKHIQIR